MTKKPDHTRQSALIAVICSTPANPSSNYSTVDMYDSTLTHLPLMTFHTALSAHSK